MSAILEAFRRMQLARQKPHFAGTVTNTSLEDAKRRVGNVKSRLQADKACCPSLMTELEPVTDTSFVFDDEDAEEEGNDEDVEEEDDE